MQKVCRQESVAVDERVVYREVIEYNTEQLDRELAQKSERRVCQRKPLLSIIDCAEWSLYLHVYISTPDTSILDRK